MGGGFDVAGWSDLVSIGSEGGCACVCSGLGEASTGSEELMVAGVYVFVFF
jgi:hypothetical protein